MSSANTAATGQVGKTANVCFLEKKNCITTGVKISYGEKINSMLGREKIKMDDLIYRDKFKQQLLDLGFYPAIVKSALEKAQAVDAVEVVRCRECEIPHNKYTGCPKLNGLVTPPDFYCSYGERRENA